jgi:uncharacterized membrane protein
MKKYGWILWLLFAIINIFGVLIYFWFNTKFYINHFGTTIIQESDLSDMQSVYNFLQNQSDLTDNFTLSEISHLHDVKTIFQYIIYTLYAAVSIFIIITLFLIYHQKYKIIYRWLFIGAIISLSIIFLLLAIILDFNYSFRIFHYVLFPQWNREFAADSRLIILFPESFFYSISKSIFMTIIIISLIFIIPNIYFKLKHQSD